MDLTAFIPPNVLEYLKGLRLYEYYDVIQTLTEFQMARLITYWYMVNNGPRVINCSQELWDLVQQIDVDFPGECYAQPYVVMIINFGTRKIVSAFDAEKKAVLVLIFEQDRQFTGCIYKLQTGVPLSEALQVSADPDQIITPELYQLIKDIAVFQTLLCYAGVKEAGWYDEKAHAKHVRLGKYTERDLQVLRVKQEVNILQQLRNATRPKGYGGGTHAGPRPHFRRAHFRHCGKGKILRLIPACFVNKQKFCGQLADTEVVLQ